MEPRWHAHRLLANRRRGRARLPPDQLHRFALFLCHPHPISQSGHDELGLSRRGGERRRRRDHLVRAHRRPAQSLYRPDGLGGEFRRDHFSAFQSSTKHLGGDAGQRAQRRNGADLRRARQRLDRHPRRFALARRRQPLHLGQRARRLAARLPHRTVWIGDATDYAGRFRPFERGAGRRGGRMALLHGLAGESDAALPLSHVVAWRRPGRAADARRSARHAQLSDVCRCEVGHPHPFDLRHAARDRSGAPARARGRADAGG